MNKIEETVMGNQGLSNDGVMSKPKRQRIKVNEVLYSSEVGQTLAGFYMMREKGREKKEERESYERYRERAIANGFNVGMWGEGMLRKKWLLEEKGGNMPIKEKGEVL
jgi:hypothetical protein